MYEPVHIHVRFTDCESQCGWEQMQFPMVGSCCSWYSLIPKVHPPERRRNNQSGSIIFLYFLWPVCLELWDLHACRTCTCADVLLIPLGLFLSQAFLVIERRRDHISRRRDSALWRELAMESFLAQTLGVSSMCRFHFFPDLSSSIKLDSQRISARARAY